MHSTHNDSHATIQLHVHERLQAAAQQHERSADDRLHERIERFQSSCKQPAARNQQHAPQHAQAGNRAASKLVWCPEGKGPVNTGACR